MTTKEIVKFMRKNKKVLKEAREAGILSIQIGDTEFILDGEKLKLKENE